MGLQAVDNSDLVVDSVVKRYPTRGEPLVVLSGVSFTLSAGENAAILGPSGSGKSTLLHILGGLDEPSEGSVSIAGVNPFALSEPELAHFRNRSVGFIFQDHHLLPQLNVLENVLAPSLAEKGPDRGLIDRAKDLLDRVGLSQRLDHAPAELSGGERQRVAAARALLYRPKLLLADEPTGNLDRTNAAAMGRLLLSLQEREGSTLVVVTHSQDLAALLERRYELNAGRLEER
jgi:lipoprotein-releasing system ATP-binding protein